MPQAFMGELVKSSAHPRWNPPRNSTLPTFTAGTSSALQGTQKPFDQLWHLLLTKLLDEELGYSAINTARSAISAVTQTAVGSQPQITRFLKGVFELRTPLPKYTHTSDVGILLDYFRKQKCSVELSLKELTKQLAALFSSFV